MKPANSVQKVKHFTGVSPYLIAVMMVAGERLSKETKGERSLRITEGVRSKERQNILREMGKSWTSRSKHLVGDAVDVAVMLPDGRATWEFDEYERLSQIVDQVCSKVLPGVYVQWGGHWSQRDGTHFEMVFPMRKELR